MHIRVIKSVRYTVLLLVVILLQSVIVKAGAVAGRTYFLDAGQYPTAIKKIGPSKLYLIYYGTFRIANGNEDVFLRGDTITDLKKFVVSRQSGIEGYRLIFESNGKVDSVIEVDTKFRVAARYYCLENNRLHIISFDTTKKKTDEFVFDYGRKMLANEGRLGTDGVNDKMLEKLLNRYEVYSSDDRDNYALSAVWMLSIGIDDYGGLKFQTCKTDAQSYVSFFKSQFTGAIDSAAFSANFHEYLLLDKAATKEAILLALKDIASKSTFNDYFIFNFSGCSNLVNNDSLNPGTSFFPFDVVVNSQTISGAALSNRNPRDTTEAYKNCIPLQILQEYIQLIPANNQLFITEAGPSAKFKTEFIKTLLQSSSAVANILNKNRVVIVPNGFGQDEVWCDGKKLSKGPINYYITSLRPGLNIYDLFKDRSKATKTAFNIKSKEIECKSFADDYFDIFFEKRFLQEYKDIFGSEEEATRGVKIKPSLLQQTVVNLTGKRYAMVVGTDNYNGKGWNKLSNPVFDVTAVAEQLKNGYGFEVKLLVDQPADRIYNAIREYYQIAKPDDQLVVYFAGHGDVEEDLLGDGFIVCTDSKSIADDPVRNTYISYTKLQKMLNNIPARQVLVLLDVCHGGTFDSKAFGKNEKREGDFTTVANKNVLQFLKDKLPLRTRKFLSSVGSEPAFDGKAGRHSPFANLLLQVLVAKTKEPGSILTLKEIYAVLEAASLNKTATLKIAPYMENFGTVDAFSEFVFIPLVNTNTGE